MSNITVKNQNLPTVRAPSAMMMAALGGVSGEGRMFPEVGIKAARWRLKPTGGEDEQVLSTFNIQFALVSANPAKSKTFYLKKYDPDGEPAAPDCFSEDGLRPHPDAQAKQSESCQNCEHNVWGSELNPMTGKKNKRCKDSKRIAIMFVGNPGEIYAWRLAPTNMMSFADFIKRDVMAQGIDLDGIAIDARFDDKSTYPHVLFSVARALKDDERAAADGLRASESAQAAVGMGAPIIRAPMPVEAVEVERALTPEPKAVTKPKAPHAVDLDSLLDGIA